MKAIGKNRNGPVNLYSVLLKDTGGVVNFC